MNAIVIDDDQPTVEVILRNIDWMKFDIEQVFKAYNIEEAKNLFLSNQIDIAVSDIEMPMGAGLDLLQWVREQGNSCQFIFLTSHERFDYASEAIRYNASGYVVKPFNPERMEQELGSAVQKVRHEEQFRKTSHYQEWFSATRSYVKSGFWSDLFLQRIIARPEIIEGEIRRRQLDLDPAASYRFALFSCGHVDDIESAWGNDGCGIFEYALNRLGAELISGELASEDTFSYHQQNKVFSVVVVPASEPDDLKLDEDCMKLCQLSRTVFRVPVTAYISNAYPLEGLASARQHIEELDYNNVIGKDRVFRESDEIVLKSLGGHILDQDRIRELLLEKKKIELLNLLKFSMQGLAAKRELDRDSLNFVRQDLLQIIYVYLYGKGIQATELFTDKDFADLELKAADSIMDMIRWQTCMVSRTLDYVSEVEQSWSIIEKARAFVRSHYQEGITRTEVADSVYLTPEYLARLFKKETGITIKQYINDYRMERAKELLSGGNVRISDVASQVGFDSFSYFSTVFKKYTGMTPNEYHGR